LGQYSDNDRDKLPKLVNQIPIVLTKNKEKISQTSTQIRQPTFERPRHLSDPDTRATTTFERPRHRSETINKAASQQLLNAIFEEFDILLADALPAADDLCQFNAVKDKLIDSNLMKQNDLLQNQITGLEARLSSLEQLESDSNIIRMGNIGLQLRNKLIRFIKPDLSYRTARDTFLCWKQKSCTKN
ncbi:unnamed protein product, partial [Didymodactylos carnosus]